MAYDKVVDSAFLEAGLTLVGDSIRAKGGTSAKLEFPNGMKAAVDAIDTSKPEQTKTATPSLSQQTISPDSGKVLSSVTVEPITSTLLTSLDSDFKAENIAEGVDMFGVTGTHAGGGGTSGVCTITITGVPFYSLLYQDADGIWQYISAIFKTPYTFETLSDSCFCAFGLNSSWLVFCDSVPDGFMISEAAMLDTNNLFAKVSPIPGSYTITLYEDK